MVRFSSRHQGTSNPLPAYKRKDRKIYLELNVEQSDGFTDIFSSLMPETPIQMSWSHYRTLLQVDSDDARLWYEKEVCIRLSNCENGLNRWMEIEGLPLTPFWLQLGK